LPEEEEPQEKYVHNPHLQKAVDDVLESHAFQATRDFKIVAVFAKGKAPADREAASCRKMSNAIRKATGLDFLLVFWTAEWDLSTKAQRHRLIVHELMHIGVNDEGNPKIIRHHDNFCEIPEHDRASGELAEKIPISPALDKFGGQAALK
jgi:predicted metallopeptidase